MGERHVGIEEKLAALKKIYAANLPEKIKTINFLWSNLKNSFSKSSFEEFHRAVHSLEGSSGTYGYLQLGLACRDLNVYLEQLKE